MARHGLEDIGRHLRDLRNQVSFFLFHRESKNAIFFMRKLRFHLSMRVEKEEKMRYINNIWGR